MKKEDVTQMIENLQPSNVQQFLTPDQYALKIRAMAKDMNELIGYGKRHHNLETQVVLRGGGTAIEGIVIKKTY